MEGSVGKRGETCPGIELSALTLRNWGRGGEWRGGVGESSDVHSHGEDWQHPQTQKVGDVLGQNLQENPPQCPMLCFQVSGLLNLAVTDLRDALKCSHQILTV